jgi:hypothetical protein
VPEESTCSTRHSMALPCVSVDTTPSIAWVIGREPFLGGDAVQVSRFLDRDRLVARCGRASWTRPLASNSLVESVTRSRDRPSSEPLSARCGCSNTAPWSTPSAVSYLNLSRWSVNRSEALYDCQPS